MCAARRSFGYKEPETHCSFGEGRVTVYMPVFSEHGRAWLAPETASDFLAVPQLTARYCRMFNTDKWLRMHVTNFTEMENGIYCCSQGVSAGGSGSPPTIFSTQTPWCPPCMSVFFCFFLGMFATSVLCFGEIRLLMK